MLSTNYYNNHFVNTKCTYIDCGIATNNQNNNKNSSSTSSSPTSYNNQSSGGNLRRSSGQFKFPYLCCHLPHATDLLVKKVCSWVFESNRSGKSCYNETLLSRSQMEAGVTEILEVILQWLIEDLNESPYILFTAFYLADKYVKKAGVRQSSVLWLILTSCIVAVKMFSESAININKIANKFDTSSSNIVKMEMEFLSIMEYRVLVEEQNVNAFLTLMYFEYNCNIKDKTEAIVKHIQDEIQLKEKLKNCID